MGYGKSAETLMHIILNCLLDAAWSEVMRVITSVMEGLILRILPPVALVLQPIQPLEGVNGDSYVDVQAASPHHGRLNSLFSSISLLPSWIPTQNHTTSVCPWGLGGGWMPMVLIGGWIGFDWHKIVTQFLFEHFRIDWHDEENFRFKFSSDWWCHEKILWWHFGKCYLGLSWSHVHRYDVCGS